MLDWIVEGIRVLIWGLTSACLMLMDVCYDIVVEIASADFLSTSEVWNWYYTSLLFLSVLIVGRIIAMYFKFAFDEEFQGKLSASHLFNKLAMVALILALLPTTLGFVSKAAVWGVRNTSVFLGESDDIKPSTLIVTSFMNTENGEYNDKGEWVAGEKVTYTLDDVDINEEGEGEQDYKFFNGIGDLFMVAIIGIAASIMLILNAIQIGKRSYGIVMKVIIAPIPISSLIVPGDETFSMWRKMIMSDYVLNFFQTLMIMIIMILSGSKVLANISVWAQIISFIAGLLLLLSGVPELSKLLGGDTSQGGILQQLASFRMATRGIGSSAANLVKGIGGKAAGLATTAGAFGAYGGGRMLGGKSMTSIQQEKQKGKQENGFMGGNKKDDGSKGSFGTPTKETANTFQNNESKSKESNQAFQNYGSSTSSETMGDAGNAGNSTSTSGSFAETGTEGGRGQQDFNYSKKGSFAGNFSDKAWNRTGLSSAASNLVKNSSRHVYQASMDRMQRSKAYRASASVKRMTSPQDRVLGE